MTIFTIGFTKKSAETFFGLLLASSVRTLIDIRLNNSSQLAGFTKGSDLEYFLGEICKCNYVHEAIFAPTKNLMDNIKSSKITLEQFEGDYLQLMEERKALLYFEEHYSKNASVCLLCSENTPEYCHRRVLADMLSNGLPATTVCHL